MKNADVHVGFEDKEVRDFLSDSYERNIRKAGYVNLDRLEEQLRELEEQLEHARQVSAALKLIEQRGWTVHDNSDDIEDYKPETWRPFVGTEEEFEQYKSNCPPWS